MYTGVYTVSIQTTEYYDDYYAAGSVPMGSHTTTDTDYTPTGRERERESHYNWFIMYEHLIWRKL